jgi:hypothetical protein
MAGVMAVLLSFGLLLTACSKELTVEQQIIAAIRDMEARIEEGERRPFMAHVAEDFVGQNGAMTVQQLNAMVLFQLHRNQRVRAQLLPIHVTSDGPDRAEARFDALITSGPGLIPDQGQKFEFLTLWQRREDEWLLVGASWQPDVLNF